MFDSDGDGKTNGEEFGDPCCMWTIGSGAQSHPNEQSLPGHASSVTLRAPVDCKALFPNYPLPVIPQRQQNQNIILIAALILVGLWLLVLIPTLIMVYGGKSARIGGFGSLMLHKRLGPPLTFLPNSPLRALDIFGLIDFIPHLLKLTVGELIIVLVIVLNLVVVFVAKYIDVSDRNSPFKLGYAVGSVSEACFGLVAFPVFRHSVLLPLFGISVERSMKVQKKKKKKKNIIYSFLHLFSFFLSLFSFFVQYHRWIGRLAVITLGVHFVLFNKFEGEGGYSLFDPTPYGAPTGGFGMGFTGSPWTGTVSLICSLILYLTAIEIVRRKLWELFVWSHILAIPALFFGAMHSPFLPFVLIIPGLMYATDWFLRMFKTYKCDVTEATVSEPDSGGERIVALTMKHEQRDAAYRAGGYAHVTIMGVSAVHSHPFSFSSRGGKDEITMHIKTMGKSGFARDLVNYVEKNGPGFQVYLTGPYGETSCMPKDYKCNIFCGGGIGITPMLSLAQEACEDAHESVTYLIFVVRNFATVESCRSCFENLAANVNNQINVIIYCTRDKEGPSSFISSGMKKTGHSSSSSSYPTSSYNRRNSDTEEYADEGGASTSASSYGDGTYTEEIVYGRRPDWLDIYARIHTAVGTDAYGVYACGPGPMVTGVEKAAQDSKVKLGCKFHTHHETFEF